MINICLTKEYIEKAKLNNNINNDILLDDIYSDLELQYDQHIKHIKKQLLSEIEL